MRNLRLVSLGALAFLGAIPPLASAHPGVGIVVDRKGNVYFTDLRQVWRISPEGTRSVAVPNVHTHELCLDSEDNLWGEHLWYEGDATKKWGHRVWRLSPSGDLRDVIPAREGFLTDSSFVRDGMGNMYWAGDGAGDPGPRVSIRKRAPDGRVSTLAGGTPGRADGVGKAAQFTAVSWIAAATDGTVYAIDFGALRRIAPDGTVSTLASDLDGSRSHLLSGGLCHHLMGLCPDARGAVYVANLGAGRVDRIGPDGKVTVFARSTAPFAPTGVTVTPSGDVFILESGEDRARVRRIGADGTDRIL